METNNNKTKFRFESLEIWQLAMELVKDIYKITKKFPDNEKFSLISQLKRAVISISLNIAEGSGRKSKKDFANFISNAQGSVLETATCLMIAKQENYIDNQKYDLLANKLKTLYFKIFAFHKSLLN